MKDTNWVYVCVYHVVISTNKSQKLHKKRNPASVVVVVVVGRHNKIYRYQRIHQQLFNSYTHTGICFSFNVDNFSKTRLLFVVVVATFWQAVSDLQFVSSVLLRKTKTAITVKLHVASLVSILAQCTSA